MRMWVIFGIITSLIGAIYDICNQNSKLKPEIFMIYRGFLVALISTPLVLLFFHIFPWQFYAIALFQGICISYLDYKYYNAYHKFGAENICAVDPLKVFIIFILWMIVSPSIIYTYIKFPIRSLIILLSIIAMVYAVTQYHKQKIGKSCLKEMFPLLCLAAIVDISNKFIMEYSEGYLLTLTFHRVAITGYIVGFINLFFNYHKIKNYKELLNIKNIQRSWFIILLVLSMIFLNLSMHYTPNPAYISVLLFLSIVWIICINRITILRGKNVPYTNIRLRWIFLLLVAAIVLIIATNQ